jgi:putative oxidoreductase
MLWLLRLLHLTFGGVFVYAGVLKVLDPARFLMDVRSFELVPDPYAAWLAMFLPWLEIFCGLAVISGCLRKGGLMILNGALIVFLFAILLSWYRGIDIRCGCFGDSGDASSNYVELIVRDVALMAIGITAMFLRPSPKAPRASLPSSMVPHA